MKNSRTLLTINEAILVALASALSVILINARNLYTIFFTGPYDIAVIKDNPQIIAVNDVITQFITAILTPNIVTFIFWLVVGLLSYTVIEFILDETKSFKDIFLTGSRHYKHPKGFSYRKYWVTFILGLIEMIIINMLLVLWVFLIFGYFIPFSSSSFVTAMTSRDALPTTLLFLGYAFLGIFLSIAGLIVLFRIFKSHKLR